jgi:hypothetical protein
MTSRRRGRSKDTDERQPGEGESGTDDATGVVESDLAEDTGPDYAAMSDDEREQAVAELVAAGQVTEDQARERVYGEVPKPTPPMQIPLPGEWDTISDAFGGRAPESSEIRLLGGKMPIEGSFPKGAEFDVLVRVKVTGVLGQDVTDEWGTVERTVRRHQARMISVQRVNR